MNTDPKTAAAAAHQARNAQSKAHAAMRRDGRIAGARLRNAQLKYDRLDDLRHVYALPRYEMTFEQANAFEGTACDIQPLYYLLPVTADAYFAALPTECQIVIDEDIDVTSITSDGMEIAVVEFDLGASIVVSVEHVIVDVDASPMMAMASSMETRVRIAEFQKLKAKMHLLALNLGGKPYDWDAGTTLAA